MDRRLITGSRPGLSKPIKIGFMDDIDELFELRDKALERGMSHQQIVDAIKKARDGGPEKEFIKRLKEILESDC